ncbi:MAG: transcriptional repressor [Deltaproteobacteria bacterium]|nr:transcriptional repressor [Deltaproteobacteria bacterium]
MTSGKSHFDETAPQARFRARRRTRQRSVIQRVLLEANRPLSPQDILLAAQTRAPGLGIATVYRTIHTMMTEGTLVAVGIPGEAARYETAGKEHHHHFQCRECDGVFDVQGCPTDDLVKLAPKGFRLESHQVVLYGVCPPCTGMPT